MIVLMSKQAYHGGAFFDAIGNDFSTLENSTKVISADVLDAWFDPSPKVIEKVRQYLSFALRTSPPTHCEGLIKMMMGVDEARQYDVTFEVEDFIGAGGKLTHGANLLDEAASNKKTTLGNLALMVVHGYDVCVFDEEGGHGMEPIITVISNQ